MTAKESLMEMLKEQKSREETEKKAELSAKRQEWLDALSALTHRFQKWLKDAVRDKLLEVEVSQGAAKEHRFGSYPVPILKIITPTGVMVRITPRARFVAGAYGRIDLECPPKKVSLIRKALPDQWQWARPASGGAGWSFVDLDEESFWETLSELLS